MGLPLYRISQKVNNDYDTFSSAIVAAPDARVARHMVPVFEGDPALFLGTSEGNDRASRVWTTDLQDIRVQKISESSVFTRPIVVNASFHAG